MSDEIPDVALPASDQADELAALAADGWRGLDVPPLTSVSQIREFQACERAWFDRYVAGLEAKGARSSALETGILIHAVLHAIVEGRDPGDALRAQRAKAQDEGQTEKSAEDAEAALALAEAVAAEWPAWADRQQPRLEVIQGSSESSFRDSGETALRGRIDRRCRVTEGPFAGEWIEDFKTHALGGHDEIRETSSFAKQGLVYVLESGARGVCWSMIAKTASRRRQKETLDDYCARIKAEYKADPDKYFRRHFEPLDGSRVLPMLASVRARHAYKATLYGVLGMGVEAFEQNEKQCFARGRCPFLPLCSGGNTSAFRKREKR